MLGREAQRLLQWLLLGQFLSVLYSGISLKIKTNLTNIWKTLSISWIRRLSPSWEQRPACRSSGHSWLAPGQGYELWFDVSKGTQFLWSKAWGTWRALGYWPRAKEALHVPLGHCSVSGVGVSPAQVQGVDNFLAKGLQSSKSCTEHQEWAFKPPAWPPGPRAKAATSTNLQRNLMSAPPVMKRPRDKQPERPMPRQVGAGAEPLVAALTPRPPRGLSSVYVLM